MNQLNIGKKGDGLPVPRMESTCMDCIFWYQCRRGEIDCHLRPLRPIESMMRA